MDGKDGFRLKHFHGPQGVIGAHGVVVADGDDRHIDPFFADQFHVAEKTGVLGHVDLFAVLGRQEKAAGIAAVGAVRQHGAVQGEGQLEVAEGIVVTAA